jgi:hypothetical protein
MFPDDSLIVGVGVVGGQNRLIFCCIFCFVFFLQDRIKHDIIAGSDPLSIEAEVTLDESGSTYHLKGNKTWVANALRADLFLVFGQVCILLYNWIEIV